MTLQRSQSAVLQGPASGAFSITPNDSTDLSAQAKALYVGGTGNIKVDMAGGGTVTLNSVPVGILPIMVSRVYSTGTTATNLIGLK
jgi:hypothetical protein